MGVPPAADFRNLDDAVLQKLQGMIDANRDLRRKVVQRGFWANGKATLCDYLVDIERYTMKDSAEAIRCPTLLTAAENDPLA